MTATPTPSPETDASVILWADTYVEWNDLAGACIDTAQQDFFYELADTAKELMQAFAEGDQAVRHLYEN